MVADQAQMFLTGPAIVKAATGEDASADDIGGSRMHTTVSGVAHLEVPSEDAALDAARSLLSFLPAHVGGAQKLVEPRPADAAAVERLPFVVPDKSSVVFDMNEVLDAVLDDRERLELMPNHAPSVLTVFGHLDGRPVGVVANQPQARGGILDAKASVKISRFVDFCAKFGLPIVTFVDVPGFLPGTVEEGRGVITQGATMLRAYVEASSPVLTVVVRKAYGGAYIAMGAKSLGADFTWAWSGSEIAVMGPGWRRGAPAPPCAQGGRAARGPARPAGRRVPRERRASLSRRRGRYRRRRDPARGDPRSHGRRVAHADARVRRLMHEAKAEIVANVWKLVASPGDEVGAGDVIAVLETMKMEIPVIAPASRNDRRGAGDPGADRPGGRRHRGHRLTCCHDRPVHEIHIPMRWADLDQLNHVNNVVYVDYAMEARAQLVDDGHLDAGLPIRHVRVDFMRPHAAEQQARGGPLGRSTATS